MTNHDMLAEGSHKTYRQILRQQEENRILKKERKALKRARNAGVEEAVHMTTLLSERLILEGRGWRVEDSVSMGPAMVTRFVMKIAVEELSERAGIA